MDRVAGRGPEYYVIGQTGEKFGPADVVLLNQWTSEGRVSNASIVEDAETGVRMSITVLPGYIAAPPVGLAYSNYQRGADIQVPNHMVKAILSTVFCAHIIGIVAIVYAAQVDGHLRRGDYDAALASSQKADKWANWAIGIPIAFFAVYAIVIAVGIATGQMK